MKRYLVIGGEVTSQNDGQRHYISPQRLIKLYGVDPAYCVPVTNMQYVGIAKRGYTDAEFNKLLVLQPDPTGQYKLPVDPNS